MDHKDLTELLHKSPKEFVENFLQALGGYTPHEVQNYRPSRWKSTPSEVHGYVITEVDSTGGGEGEGEYADVVFRVASSYEGATDALHFRITGRYDSWNGTEWDGDFDIVEPREVLVTQWFPK